MDKINKIVKTDIKEELKKIYPEVFEDNKINFDKLKSLLSGEIIEKKDDRFYFNWAGKSSIYKLIQSPAYGTLKPDKEKSVDFNNTENIVIVGENLETLKLLLKPYFGKVKMIYIDPPYNTGKDFIYHDNFKEPLKDYLEKTGQIDSEGKKLTTNTETRGRYHSDWLNFMYPRLFLARSLLRDDGVIFISIDDHEVHHLRMIMNEIFGEENYLGTISVVNNLKGRSDDNYIATANEFLLVYAKNKELYEMGGFPLNEEQLKEYDQEDEWGKYKEVGFRKTGKNWRREDRPLMFYPIYFNEKTKEISLERKNKDDIEILPLTSEGFEGRWRWEKKTFLERKDKDIVIRKVKTDKWQVFTKMRLNENGEERTLLPKSVWIDPKYDTAKGAKILKEMFGKDIFDNPKPLDFISDILLVSTNNNSLILDFFAGSGTTGHAVWDLNKEDGGNRKFILIQLDEPVDENTETGKNALSLGLKTVADICIERLRRVSEKYKKENEDQPIKNNQDFGFKVFRLDKSNFNLKDEFEFDPSENKEELKKKYLDWLGVLVNQPLVSGWKEIDVIYEVMLKEGLNLNSKIEKVKIKDDEFYYVNDKEQNLDFYISLGDQFSPETIEEIRTPKFKGKTFIFLDKALTDNDKINLSAFVRLKVI